MYRSDCDHVDLIDFDPAGRRFCTNCGEVIDLSEPLRQVEYDSKPEFQIIPKLSSYRPGITSSTAKMMDAVSDECEKVSGYNFSPIIKQQVMSLVDSYLQASDTKNVHGYEDLVRIAMLVVLRQNGYSIQASQIIPRFDTKLIPAFRLLNRLGSKLNVRLTPVDKEALARVATAAIVHDLNRTRGETLTDERTIIDMTTCISVKLLECLINVQKYPSLIKVSHAIACSYFCIGHIIAFDQKPYTLISAIRANNAIQFTTAVYRDFDIIKKFAKHSLQELGISGGNERSNFLENLSNVNDHYNSRREVSKRIRLISP